MHADNSAHLRAAARRRHDATRKRALDALNTRPSPTTMAGLARAAGVARSWIYTQPDILARIRASPAQSGVVAPRVMNTGHRHNPNLAAENARLRHQLAAAHRQLGAKNHRQG
ncbi:transposase [Gordonia paraffinivorans]|uniref:transposase n=1 Tax=Gordonia paraffinivorans TaxID=175628 RepID=UPI0014455832|nr:transposase [Gordonia paraffinivorans]